MRLISLNSGSNGNAIYVEAGDVRLLFDAGISGIQLEQRLASLGLSAHAIDALFISHDHADHIRNVGVYMRRFAIPLYITERTLSVSRRRASIGELHDIQHFRAGGEMRVGHVTVHAIGTPHDAADGVVFVIDDGEHRLAICTDVGHVFKDLQGLVGHVDGLFLESNYDEHMLATGNYPAVLKRRISGPRGHISNKDAAQLVAKHAGSRLQWLCLAHLSEENNTPKLALTAHRQVLGEAFPIHIASRYGVSSVLTLGAAPVVKLKRQPRLVQPPLAFHFD